MVHGVLLINKVAGGTSHSIVSSLRHIMKQKKVGHAGTLDPMAEGLMIILLGYGTKLSDYLLMNDKGYRFVLRLGVVTDTLDKTGEIVTQKEVSLSPGQIRDVLENSQGTLSLPVPLVSAVKIKGKKLYEYKRENKPIALPLRDMHFYNLNVKDIKTETVELELSCSKGSYIRSWVAFVGDVLGTGACLEKLTRLFSSPFHVESSLTVKEVEARLKKEKSLCPDSLFQILAPAFIPFSQALPHIKAVRASRQDEEQLKSGQISGNLKIALQEDQKTVNKNKETQIIRVMSYSDEKMLALLKLQPFAPPKFLRVFSAGLS